MLESVDLIDKLVQDWHLERPELDTSAMEIVGRILQLGKILEKRANQALKENKIHYTDLDVLATLRRSGKPYQLSPKELMQSVLITSGAMTALLDRLTKLQLISRDSHPDDGRVKLATLTQKGKITIDAAIEVRFQEASNSTEELTIPEKEQLAILLKKMILSLS